jgi:ferritin-like metal-binding protein YciE
VPQKNTADAINSYVTDMLSLESHIEKAIRSQIQDLKDYPDFTNVVREFHGKVEHHISDLKGLVGRREATGAVEAVKRAGAAVAGVAAGIIDLVRTEGLPKNLRDDYTAFNLASIGYLMLHTTATSLGDREVADLARQHYADYANVIMRLSRVVPASVVRYLQAEGLPAREDALIEVNRTVEDAWRGEVRTAQPIGTTTPFSPSA